MCVLGAAGQQAEEAFARVLNAYQRETGRQPYVVQGSSQGALEFGYAVLRPVR